MLSGVRPHLAWLGKGIRPRPRSDPILQPLWRGWGMEFAPAHAWTNHFPILLAWLGNGIRPSPRSVVPPLALFATHSKSPEKEEERARIGVGGSVREEWKGKGQGGWT